MRDGVRLRLCIMMFLEYAVWGAWGVSIGGYMYETLHFDGYKVGWIFSTTAVAAMISPLFVGYVADRLFATEKLLAGLHLIGAVLLLAAAFITDFPKLFAVMQIYALCYMPTLALTNSISFANIADSKKDFPGIRVWGTWGWIIAGLGIGFLVGGTTNRQFLVAAGLSALLGVFCLYLPHTPPRAKVDPSSEATKGTGVLRLLGDPTFLVFVVCSFLICIPLSFYYTQANGFLVQLEAPYPTALQTIGQFSEVAFMAAMPFFIARLGVKRMLTVGMLAWVLRYLAFATLNLPAVAFGLLLHGVCYDFYFVAAYIYVDTRVDERQRASAQSFIAFVMLGVGMFIGSLASGKTVNAYPPIIQVKAQILDESSTGGSKSPQAPPSKADQGDISKKAAGSDERHYEDLPLPSWEPGHESAFAKSIRTQFPAIARVFFPPESESPFAKKFGLKPDSLVLPSMIREDYVETDPVLGTATRYDRDSFVEAIIKADRNGDGKVDRAEWVIARRRQWPFIWLWPAAGALITAIIFVIGFRERVPTAGEEHVGFQAIPEDAEP
jgi:nucleoside transporter